MKSKRVLALLSGATLGATGASFSGVAYSQPEMAPQTTMTVQMTRHAIRLRNIPASLMAWWLDPSHNALPIQILSGRENAKMFPSIPAPTGLPLGTKVPALPVGIERIIAIDPQNALLVFGTEAGVQELQRTVETLDKPLRQVEVEAKFIQIAEADVAALPIDFGAAQPGQPNIGFARANIEAILTTLIAQNKAKVITAPRVTAIDNLPAVLKSVSSSPVVVGFRGENGEFRELLNPQEKQFSLFMRSAFGLGVMPTLNADETMTLLLAPWQQMQLDNGDKTEQIDLGDSNQIQTVSRVQDGLTIGFKGVDSRLFGLFAKDQPTSNIIVLVTARILRRAEDDKVKTVALKR